MQLFYYFIILKTIYFFFKATTEKNMERIVREAFSDVIIASLHPRTSISITVQITQDDGSVRNIF